MHKHCFLFKKGNTASVMDMYSKSATFHIGVSHPRRDIPEILPLIQSGKFKPEQITTLTADWIDAPNAYLEKTTKLVLKRNPQSEENYKKYNS